MQIYIHTQTKAVEASTIITTTCGITTTTIDEEAAAVASTSRTITLITIIIRTVVVRMAAEEEAVMVDLVGNASPSSNTIRCRRSTETVKILLFRPNKTTSACCDLANWRDV